MAGLSRQTFNPDLAFVKLPASWLRAGGWESEPTDYRPRPKPTAADNLQWIIDAEKAGLDPYDVMMGTASAPATSPQFDLEASFDGHGTYRSN